MKPSKLYTDRPALFAAVEFAPELNVVMAQIRLPENQDRDTHNLGKTTLGRLLDFGFLAGKDPKFFLFRHEDRFGQFVFFLEIELLDGTYVTVRRSVAEQSRIAFKKHFARHQDFSTLADREWDHMDVPFDRAKEMLDSYLDWRTLKPWPYRKGLGYFLRSQEDFGDVFHLRRFANSHADWKPFLAHILGFDAKLIAELYEKEAALTEMETRSANIRQELSGGDIEDAGKIDGILLLKMQEIEKKQALLDSFDFRSEDKSQTKTLVDKIDEKIAALNARRYSLMANRKKIVASLQDDQILFNPDEAAELFQEAGMLFGGQIKRDFQQLIDFNKAITEERQGYLIEERADIDVELKAINGELNTLGKRRAEMLAFLSETDTFAKYRRFTSELVTLRADVQSLQRQRDFVHRLQQLRTDIRSLQEDKVHLQSAIEADVEMKSATADSLFSAIRLYFNEIVEEVIDSKALLNVSVNRLGHLEFKAELLDEAGNATSADRGHSYRKLLCVAFDLALIRAHLGEAFPRFAYHDGVLESLDDRKKEVLISVLRRYTSMGIQSIVTLIDSDLPKRAADQPFFEKDEIVLLLHDEDESGRLFKMPSW
ncbi:DUF2326 domain-containing protein [Novosphingobium guangzhouense]|uniref:DUF2326 domain-containing protein n=1 Tax=Novosphingobium guangzhouense TaxID=1850347 RepID=A0A2K2G3U5_9SPHN|nr:DUF2326 domain-containing protein [Novosphingobium guangzhouense]PNU05706.1 hypothetical protein A8V01_15275 [Novosphingobium guangzhouense]